MRQITAFRGLREEKGLSQLEWSEQIGCSRSTVVRVENNETEYSLRHITAIERMFQQPIHVLLNQNHVIEPPWYREYNQLNIYEKHHVDEIVVAIIKVFDAHSQNNES